MLRLSFNADEKLFDRIIDKKRLTKIFFFYPPRAMGKLKVMFFLPGNVIITANYLVSLYFVIIQLAFSLTL